LTVSYDKATDDTKKFSSDIAKDVTNKAVNKVTERVTQSQTTKIIETFEETEKQSFDNKNGQGHVSGVYEWVEKVYLAQVFNLGRHMLLDIMVPEPGASLLAAATIPPAGQKLPVPPDPLGTILLDAVTQQPILDSEGHKQLDIPLTPDQLDYDNKDSSYFYGKWIAKYQVTGVDPKPSGITVSKAIADDASNYKRNDVQFSDNIKLDDGYKAATLSMSVAFRPRDDGGDQAVLFVQVGQKQYNFVASASTAPNVVTTSVIGDRNRIGNVNSITSDRKQLNGEEGSIGVTVMSVFTDEATLDIEVECEPTDALFARWQLQVYDKIVAAWQKLQSDYEAQMSSLRMQQATVGPLGAAHPSANRLTERIELKRSCIAIMDNANETVRGVAPNVAMQDSPDPNAPDKKSPYLPILPEPMLSLAQQLGTAVRWFEQAFEWENIAYVSYPYFWGRRQTWIQRLNLKNDDPLFVNFIQAGYARVVIPVRLGFECAVHFYLHTGLPWLGGDLPPIGDKTQNPLYLDIAEEIKALTGGGEKNEKEVPIGDPWEYVLPTTLIKLRKDDALPEWHRVGVDAKEDEKNYPSDQPGGTWLWRDGPPK